VFTHLWQDYVAIAILAAVGLALGFAAKAFFL
jgi:hypothetical protein